MLMLISEEYELYGSSYVGMAAAPRVSYKCKDGTVLAGRRLNDP
jgi:hypothetical protein